MILRKQLRIVTGYQNKEIISKKIILKYLKSNLFKLNNYSLHLGKDNIGQIYNAKKR